MQRNCKDLQRKELHHKSRQKCTKICEGFNSDSHFGKQILITLWYLIVTCLIFSTKVSQPLRELPPKTLGEFSLDPPPAPLIVPSKASQATHALHVPEPEPRPNRSGTVYPVPPSPAPAKLLPLPVAPKYPRRAKPRLRAEWR